MLVSFEKNEWKLRDYEKWYCLNGVMLHKTHEHERIVFRDHVSIVDEQSARVNKKSEWTDKLNID